MAEDRINDTKGQCLLYYLGYPDKTSGAQPHHGHIYSVWF